MYSRAHVKTFAKVESQRVDVRVERAVLIESAHVIMRGGLYPTVQESHKRADNLFELIALKGRFVFE